MTVVRRRRHADPEFLLSDTPELSRWAEYRIVCADGESEHRLDFVSVRFKAMQQFSRLDGYTCGPHSLQQRLVERANHPWGELLKTDPQTEALSLIHEVALGIPCPKCGEPPMESCINLTEWNSLGTKTPTKWPHAERLTPAFEANNNKENN